MLLVDFRWAWHDLGNMPIDEAQKQYIDKLQELNPEWKPSVTLIYFRNRNC
ncbi:unnamed protein product [Schistosoma curassoni]|uniref:ACB domain-containing protein n=1 Tax=Schistosoma curassoni TaxID=6186 RepID=A0A183JMP1_9TREM|nr:unnamed protein product [Schistosoma curassoni]